MVPAAAMRVMRHQDLPPHGPARGHRFLTSRQAAPARRTPRETGRPRTRTPPRSAQPPVAGQGRVPRSHQTSSRIFQAGTVHIVPAHAPGHGPPYDSQPRYWIRSIAVSVRSIPRRLQPFPPAGQRLRNPPLYQSGRQAFRLSTWHTRRTRALRRGRSRQSMSANSGVPRHTNRYTKYVRRPHKPDNHAPPWVRASSASPSHSNDPIPAMLQIHTHRAQTPRLLRGQQRERTLDPHHNNRSNQYPKSKPMKLYRQSVTSQPPPWRRIPPAHKAFPVQHWHRNLRQQSLFLSANSPIHAIPKPTPAMRRPLPSP